jgi:DNA repair exonuclease SbcCD ATPase subunit
VNPIGVVLGNFLTYKGERLTFPATGLLMVTGANGAGKSTVLESIAWALWGETIRGSDPTPDGAVAVHFHDGTMVTRERKGRKTTDLKIADIDGDRSGQTPTETQARINERFGDWRRFCATRVFSRELLSRFGNATNKERQTLLEGILGLEQFSRAEKLARGILSTRKAAQSEADSVLREANAALASSRAAGAPEPASRSVPSLEAEIAPLAASYEALLRTLEPDRARLQKLTAMRDRAATLVSAKKYELSSLRDQVTRLDSRIASAGKLDDCPVCLRVVGPSDKRTIAKHFDDEAAPLRERIVRLERDLEVLRDDIADQEIPILSVTETYSGKQVKIGELTSKLRVLDNALAAARVEEAQAKRHAVQVEAHEAAVESASSALRAADDSAHVAVLACDALGSRGARVELFNSALWQLEMETNSILARLGIPMTISLLTKKTQASGKEVDEVTLRVEGAGGGGYLGTSGGERTRIDLAMILALARMAGAEGILMFDEIFDPLDDDGMERVAELLNEMAQTRLCLVTSHNERLVALVSQSNVWRVEKADGKSRIIGGA